MSTKHTVRAGECLSLIARRYGFNDYRIVYEHPDNADFRRKRPDPNIIQPGDVVVIPDKDPKWVDRPTGATHRFKVTLPQRHIRIYLENTRGEAVANQPCTLQVAGVTYPLVSGGDGLIEKEVPLDTTEAVLLVDGTERVLRLGDLNPMRDTDDGGVSGVQGRLRNLAYLPGPVDGILGPHTAAAICAFQVDHQLDPTGVIDDALLAKLQLRHRS